MQSLCLATENQRGGSLILIHNYHDFFRRDCTSTFMEQDARYLDKVKASKSDNAFFLQCREVVLALVTELGKAVLPKVETL